MKEYNDLTKILQGIYDLPNAEELFSTLEFIAGLMLEDEKSLGSAHLLKTFNHGRLILMVDYSKYDKHKD